VRLCETITTETAKRLSGVSEADDEQDKDELEENETWKTVREAMNVSTCIFNSYDIILCSHAYSYCGRSSY